MIKGYQSQSKSYDVHDYNCKMLGCTHHNGKMAIIHRFWEPTYEDSMNLIARVPVVAAYVYRR